MKHLLLFMLGFASLYAQSRMKIIDSTTAKPIPAAVVSDGVTHRTAGSGGVADISAFDTGKPLVVSAPGYRTKMVLLSNNSKNLPDENKGDIRESEENESGKSQSNESTGNKKQEDKNIFAGDTVVIFLAPLSEELDEILVSGEKPISTSVYNKEIELSEMPWGGNLGLPELIKEHFSLNLKEYGGAGALKQISFRGLSAENSLVLFNGIRVNDIRTGGFDLSGVNIVDLSYAGFSSAISKEGSISAGGVLSLGTRPVKENGAYLTLKTDNAGLISFAGSGRLREGGFSLSVSGERSWSSNKFDYEFNGQVLQRSNSHFNRSFLSLTAGQAWAAFSLDFYTNYSLFNSGIPGFVVSNNTSSSQAVNRTEGSLSILRLKGSPADNTGLEISAAYNYQQIDLDDPNLAWYKGNGNDRSGLNSISLNFSADHSLYGVKLTGGYGLELGSLNDIKTVLSNQRRETSVERTVHRFILKGEKEFEAVRIGFSSLTLNAGLNYDIFSQKGIGSREENLISWSAGVATTPNFYKNLSLKGNYFRGARVPSYNEYYYSSLFTVGNLKPEVSSGFEVGFVIQKPVIFVEAVNFTYYRLNTEEKIIWVPSIIGLQVPRNVAKTRSVGFEASVEVALPVPGLKAEAAYFYSEAVNISPFGTADGSHEKQLIYSPKQRVVSSLSWESERLSIRIDHRFTGESFYTSDNDPKYRIAPNNVFDLHLAGNFKIGAVTELLSLSFFNIFNENYKIIQSYPMPLRSIVFSITTKI
ncbi:MAG: TonB-dependent receptor plug domain-containing protein [Ignavibacteriales bacterium]|nr:TonB-dependent receptor plug domain-containing protein [Ignavibacteria bacterium]MCZ2144164.1 TonB-dependent receptor plug domain-containing protein [Ignavibacteriales bacterium]